MTNGRPEEEGTAATRHDRPRRVPEPDPTTVDAAEAPVPPAPDPETGGSSLITPEQAMHLEEVRRLRLFAGFLAGICTIGVAFILTFGGDPLARHVHAGAVALTGVVATAYFIYVKDAARYRPAYVFWLVVISCTANATGFWFWGVLSGYIAVVTVSAYVVTVGGQRTTILVGSILSTGAHIGLNVAILAGWIEDRAIIQPEASMSAFDQAAAGGLLDLVMFGAIALGLRTRATTRAVLEEHNLAVRDLARREAQLAEAHAEARDAQESAGRFTGQRVGRFLLGRLLGRGAMGEIYAAEAEGVGACAVKLLASHLLADETAQRRFQREARAIAQLASPHVVRIVEVSPADAALPYLAMELLTGIDLAALIKEQPIRSLPEVIDLVEQIAEGLDAAHAAGIVHRDLKPHNVFGAGPAHARTWKVLDFGVAKLVDGGATLTHNQIVGTPGYMAPEQARGEPVDARTDVYALGVLIYRLLTGIPAIVPGEVHAMLYEVVYRMPPRPTSLVELPAGVEAVLAVALAKAPDQRFASAGELARALAAAATGAEDPAVTARAAAVLARSPWGHWSRRVRRATVGS